MGSKLFLRSALITGLLCAVGLASGCRLGPSVQADPLARSPAGAAIEVRFSRAAGADRSPVSGELLTLTDTMLVMLATARQGASTPPSVTFIPLRMVDRLAVPGVGTRISVASQRPHLPWQVAQRIRLRARYSQGISDALLRALLESYGQEAAAVYPPTPAPPTEAPPP